MSQKLYFPRKGLKQQAKDALRGHWKTAIAIAIIYLILTAISFTIGQDTSGTSDLDSFAAATSGDFASYLDMAASQPSPDPGTSFLIGALVFVFSILVSGIFELAFVMWTLSIVQRRGNMKFGGFMEKFAYFGKGITTYLWQVLWLVIWNIVYMIPLMIAGGFLGYTLFAGSSEGLVAVAGVLFALALVFYLVFITRKNLSYAMAFYAVGDAPDYIGARKGLRESIAITRGHLWDLFVLYLSFLGWIFLTIITLGLAGLYAVPYIKTTYATSYMWLRDLAFDTGVSNPDDYGLHRRGEEDFTSEVGLSDESRHDRIESLPNASEEEARDLDRALDEHVMEETFQDDADRDTFISKKKESDTE